MTRPIPQSILLSVLVATSGFLSAPSAIAFTVKEKLVSVPALPMPDIEFDRRDYQVAWEDQQERLWLADVSPEDGSFDLAGARILDDGLPPLAGLQNGTGTANGPEWAFTTGFSQILYTKALGTERGNLEVYRAVREGNEWVTGPFPDADSLSYGRKGYVPIGNTRPNDPSPGFAFYREDGNGGTPDLAWRKLNEPIGTIVDDQPEGIVRWASGTSNELVYPRRAPDGSKQIFLFNTDLQTRTQLTFSPSLKTDCWLFNAPEFGGEQVLAVMETVKGAPVTIGIYRKIGITWTLYNTLRPPSIYDELDSPEPVVFNGQSYIFCAARQEKKGLAEIWIMSIRADAPFYRKVSDDAHPRARQDPEYLITNFGLVLYSVEIKTGRIYQCQTGLGPKADDVITGTDASEEITGTERNDYIVGKGLADTLTGGAGADQFAYEKISGGGDVIQDFKVGEDLLNFVLLAANSGYTGKSPLADGFVQIKGDSENSQVWIDPDGKNGPEKAMPYISLVGVNVAELRDKKNFLF